jgi:hypothetical protein
MGYKLLSETLQGKAEGLVNGTDFPLADLRRTASGN